MAQSELNRLALELSEICRDKPLEEKWLLAPSLRVGYQWLDAVAHAGQPVLNVRVKTLGHLALELAAPGMEQEGLTLLRGLREEVVAARVFATLKKNAKGGGYLAGLAPSPGLTRAVSSMLRDLRAAGLSSEGLKARLFEVETKGREVSSLLSHYEKELADGRLLDYAGLLLMAAERLRSDQAAIPPCVLLLAPEDLVEEWSGLQMMLWGAVPEAARVILQVDQPLMLYAAEETTDASLLRFLPDPPAAPSPANDDTVKIFRAMGEVNEVREVLRRCVERAIPFDQVEILHSDAETYVPLVFEIASRLDLEGDKGLPVTFAEGIPTRYARPARALAGWLAWLRDDCSQSTLVHLVREGLLETGRGGEEGVSFARLGAMLRALPIGNGRDRFPAVLNDEIAYVSSRIESYEPDEEEDEDPELLERHLARLGERLNGLRLLEELVEGLLALVPENPTQPGLLAGAVGFLTTYARSLNGFDAYSRRLLIELIEEMESCLGGGDVAGLDIRAWLESLPASARVGGAGPRPGCLFVNNIFSGGNSCRRHTFIVGLDDSRFPGAGLQDPLLLDAERGRLSDHLLTASARLSRKEMSFARLAARLRGNVTLSYSCRDLADDRERFPSPVVLNSWRVVSGEREGDQAGLASWLQPPASFAPDDPGRCIDATEWWLWRMCGEDSVDNVQNVVAEHFPHLGRGFQARAARRSRYFTEYDGNVPAAGQACDPRFPEGPVLSHSRLQVLGKCPMEYFFRFVLGIEPPEEFTMDPAVWLDALDRGELLHSVFRVFMQWLCHKGMLPELSRDAALLEELLDTEIKRWRRIKPPPNLETFEREVRELRRTARIFLAEEELFCRASRPVFLETSIGVVSEGQGTPLDIPDPLELMPAEGLKIRARGRIDRIDDVSGGDLTAFYIWDYKTGSDYEYDLRDPFRQGRSVQPLLYLELAKERLRSMYPDAEVKGFGYFFPGRNARQERYAWQAAELEGGRRIIADLCEMLSTGCFPFTDNVKDVRSSVYAAAFGDISLAAEDVARKMESPENQELEPFRRLRGVG